MMGFNCSSGRLRKRVKMIIKSAVFKASRPGMLLFWLGLIVPFVGSIANRTVHLKPWCLARILANCGRASSERYSSSPLTSTMCLPLPGPSFPSTMIQGSAAREGTANALVRATSVRMAEERMAVLSFAQMFIREIEEDFPVIASHGMLAGANVIAKIAIDQSSWLGHLLGLQAAGAQEAVNGVGRLQDLELPLRVGPGVLHGVREQHRPGSHQGNEAV